MYFFRIEVVHLAGHMLRHGKDLHLLRNGGLDDIFKPVLSMAAELAGMAVMREWHGVAFDLCFSSSRRR